MARDSLAAHRAELRRLIGDPAGAGSTWTDDDLDVALDRTRVYYQYRELTALVNRATNRYDRFEGPTWWEAPVTLYDWANAVVVPTTDDLVGGVFTFDPGRADHYLVASGWAYDLYGAAVVVLDWWIARAKNEYDVSVGGDSFSRSQKLQNLQALRGELAGKSATTGSVTMVPAHRSDLQPGRIG